MGLLTPLTFAQHCLSPLSAFTFGAYFLHNGRLWQWTNITLPTLKTFLEARTQNVSGNKWMPQNAFFSWTRDLLVSPKTTLGHFVFHPPSPFPCNFCNCNSGGICTASQFWVQLKLLYTAWSNAYSETGPEVTLRPLVTSGAKDYKGHSLVQTEPPNTQYAVCNQHKQTANRDSRRRKTAARNGKRGRCDRFGKRNVLMSDLNESREDVKGEEIISKLVYTRKHGNSCDRLWHNHWFCPERMWRAMR